MVTKKIDVLFFNEEDFYSVTEVLFRMGWCFDYHDTDKEIVVNVPVDDEELFDFLDIYIFN